MVETCIGLANTLLNIVLQFFFVKFGCLLFDGAMWFLFVEWDLVNWRSTTSKAHSQNLLLLQFVDLCFIIFQFWLILLFIRVDQCRMKMGLILTGVGDKVWLPWTLASSYYDGNFFLCSFMYLFIHANIFLKEKCILLIVGKSSFTSTLDLQIPTGRSRYGVKKISLLYTYEIC